MIRIIICDDDVSFADKIKNMTIEYCRKENIQYKIDVFYSGEDLSVALIQKADLLFLDVEMDGINGIDAAKRIRGYNSELLIVYISSYVEYATFGYNVNAFRYILKNTVDVFFKDCMDSVLIHLKKREEYIEIKVNRDFIKIYLNKIVYFMSQGRKVIIKTTDKLNQEYEYYASLSDIENQLIDKGFLRLQRGYLANMNYINKISKGIAYMVNNEEIFISRENSAEILAKYLSFRSK